MNIVFKKESLFEQFSILPGTTKEDILKKFQIEPELRKKLPIYIKLINDESKLYIEELFSTYINNEFCGVKKYLEMTESQEKLKLRIELAALIDYIRNYNLYIEDKELGPKVLFELIEKIYIQNSDSFDFAYSKVDLDDTIFNGFKLSLWCEVDNMIASMINNLDPKVINKVFSELKKQLKGEKKDRFLNKFSESISIFLESVTSRLEDNSCFESSLLFILGLDKELLQKQNVYPSYKFYCNKLIKNIKGNEKIILKNFATILSNVTSNDNKFLLESFINCCLNFLQLDNIDKYSFNEVYSISKYVKNVISVIEENNMECENINVAFALVAIADQGSEWYSNYKTNIIAIKNKHTLSASLYDICNQIHSIPSLRACKVMYFNMLSDISGFENEILVMVNKKESYEKIIQFIKENGSFVDYSSLESEYGSQIITVSNIENLIFKYYALTILNVDLVEAFDNIRQSIFIFFALLGDTDKYNFRDTLIKGELMKKFLVCLPNDWSIGSSNSGLTVKEILKTKFNVYSGSNYGDSKTRQYIKKCDAVRYNYSSVSSSFNNKSYSSEASSSSNNESYSNGGCYIATAVYGSYDCPQVWTLRRYRDFTLAKEWQGRMFIHIYYSISPLLVKWWGDTKWFKKIWKSKLDFIVEELQKKGVEDTPYEDKRW